MSQYKAREPSQDILTRERERYLAMAVRKVAGSTYLGTLQRAFQEAGCSCNPYRAKLTQLEAEYRTRQQRLQDELDNSDLGRELKELRLKVKEIDRVEHPSLDAQADRAYLFLSVWLLDEVRQGNSEILESSSQDISRAYTDAWIKGWRPKSLKKQRTSRE